MVIKRSNKSESADLDAQKQEHSGSEQQQQTTDLAYRRKLNDATFEWSKDPLPELTLEEMQAVRETKLSVASARVIKGLQQKGLRYKAILSHVRDQKGFSVSSVSKLHAALGRVNKKNKK